MSKTPSDTGALDAILRIQPGPEAALLRLKLRKMRTDPFMFFRGSDHLFCRDSA